jgi:DNA polymerase/3'-5' exonuclease PolX
MYYQEKKAGRDGTEYAKEALERDKSTASGVASGFTMALDTIGDALELTKDSAKYGYHKLKGNDKDASEALLDMKLDAAALAIPGIGATVVKKGAKAVKSVTKGVDKLTSISKNIPFGFSSFGELRQFGSNIQSGFSKLGHKDTTLYLQGSSVTGKSFLTKESFDVGRKSDFDLAVSGTSLFEKAEKLGLTKGNRTRSINLGSDEAKLLGINAVLDKASKLKSRDVNIMIFKSVDDIKKKGKSFRVPTKNDF